MYSDEMQEKFDEIKSFFEYDELRDIHSDAESESHARVSVMLLSISFSIFFFALVSTVDHFYLK